MNVTCRCQQRNEKRGGQRWGNLEILFLPFDRANSATSHNNTVPLRSIVHGRVKERMQPPAFGVRRVQSVLECLTFRMFIKSAEVASVAAEAHAPAESGVSVERMDLLFLQSGK